jgi:hypothetical protein
MARGRRGNPAAFFFWRSCYDLAVKAHPVWPALLSFAIPVVGWSLGFIVGHDIFAWLGLFGGIAVAALSGARILWAQVKVGDAADRRQDLRAELAILIAEAEQLKEAVRALEPLADVDPSATDWYQRTTTFVRVRLGEAFAARLLTDPLIRGGEPFGLPSAHLGRWRWLNYRVLRLQEFASELA